MKGESKEETLTSCQAQKRSREVWALKAASTWPDTGGAPTQLGLPGSPSWPPCMEQGCVRTLDQLFQTHYLMSFHTHPRRGTLLSEANERSQAESPVLSVHTVLIPRPVVHASRAVTSHLPSPEWAPLG